MTHILNISHHSFQLTHVTHVSFIALLKRKKTDVLSTLLT